MPELPEVETVVRGLRAALIGRRIERMWHDWAPTIHSPAPDEFAASPDPVFDGDHVWAVARDELGVERVMRYRIEVGDVGGDGEGARGGGEFSSKRSFVLQRGFGHSKMTSTVVIM